MSIICAVNDLGEDCVWVGCNDRATIGNLISPSVDWKWVHGGDWLIGVTGNGPCSEALALARDKFPGTTSTVIEVVDSLRAAFADFEIGEIGEGYRRYSGSGLLVHKSGLIYEYDISFCLTEVPPGLLWARGSATDMAIGASKALGEFILSKKELITKTIDIVIENDIDCPGKPLIKRFTRAGGLLDE